ncbi:radical SAM protein [Micromonospora mangrovi]|uniref:Radical SAM protein n=2 Tax=Micromonospora TaxID=1873 RepID=A0AAU7M752_9ACTN
MPPVALTLHRSRFDPDRVRTLPRDGHLLVIDQVSGRWTTVDQRVEPLLPLVDQPPALLPTAAREPVARLRQLLLDQGIGVVGGEKRFSELNTLILKLTNACNHACAYCYDFEVFEKATTIDRAVAVAAIEQALEIAPAELAVILHGGEPMLLWPLIEDLVVTGERLAAERGRRIRFVGQSNFSRLTDRVVEFSGAHDIAWGVSVDGPPPVHDLFRRDHRGRGTYDAFASALARYPDFVRSAGVMSTITAANQRLLLPLARHFRDVGMTTWD